MHCHNHNVVHRDLKPENILFARSPSSSPYSARDPTQSSPHSPFSCCQRDGETTVSPVSKSFLNSPSKWPSVCTCCRENAVAGHCCCEGAQPPCQRPPSACSSGCCSCRLPSSCGPSLLPCPHLRCSSACTFAENPSKAPPHVVQAGHGGGNLRETCWSGTERSCQECDHVDGRRCWCSHPPSFFFPPRSSQATLDCVEKRREEDDFAVAEVLGSHNCCSIHACQRRLTDRRSDEAGACWGCRGCGLSGLKSQRLERRREFLSSAIVKIVDFGAACASARGQLRGTACGTVHYVSLALLSAARRGAGTGVSTGQSIFLSLRGHLSVQRDAVDDFHVEQRSLHFILQSLWVRIAGRGAPRVSAVSAYVLRYAPRKQLESFPTCRSNVSLLSWPRKC